jgi:hypothetical protein
VLTFQKHGGCADSPGTVHAVAGEHAAQAAGAFAYVPTGQLVELKAQVVAPAGLYAPAGQGMALIEDSGQYEPAGQRTGAPEAQT